MRRLRELDPNGDKIIMQRGTMLEKFPSETFATPEEVDAWNMQNVALIAAGSFGGTGHMVQRLAHDADKYFKEEMLQRGTLATEQHFLLVSYKRNTSMYHLISEECPRRGCFGWYNTVYTMVDHLGVERQPAQRGEHFCVT